MNLDVQQLSTRSTAPSLWPAVGMSFGVAIGNGFSRFGYALLLPAMRDDLGWTYAAAGWMNTANALGYVVGAVSGYLLLRRFRPSQLFIFGLLLTVVSLTATGFRSDLWWLTSTRVISGIGAAWVFAIGGALVSARYHASPELRGTATGIYFAGAGLGIVVSGILINPVLAHVGNHGWPAVWAVLGIVAAAMSIWPLAEAQRIGGAANSTVSGVLDLHGLYPSMIAYFFFASGYIVYITFIFAWIHIQHMSLAFGTLAWVLLGFGVIGSPFAWRRALSSWNPPVTLAASCVVTLLGILVPTITASAFGIVISAGLFGLGVFIAPSSIAVLTHRVMPPNQWAKTITLFTVVFSIGQAIGPVLAGWIADHSSLDSALLFGAALLGGATFIALVRRSRISGRMAC
ncbi:MAG TPA: MFS transporter [Betaproteobacteria bacterium]|nr:MFS transporter [Betaproteobacteria bacterium]